MAADPKAKLLTVTYPKGTMTATRGLIEFMLGTQTLQWKAPSSGPQLPGSRRKRVYGTRQRAAAAGGRELTVVINDGSSWVVRVTGADIDFLDYVLSKAGTTKIQKVYTKRGTIYGPQFPEEN